MANWIRVIAIGLIFVLSLFNLRLALQSVDSSSKRGGLYIGLIIVISVAILSLFQSLFPTSLKLVSEEVEVAETHSLATLKTDSRLSGNAALSFGYLTEEDEYVLMVKQDDGGYRRTSYPVDNAVVYEDVEADDARIEVVDQYAVIRETYEFPIVGEWTRDRRELTDCWVLGILPVPTYVTAGYSINGYIEDLGERIAKEESAGRRAELLADFNELRDCASRAANLPAIFQKYFEGIEKVIVFCPNVFELNEIEKMCPQWFSRVNGNVHTYVVHSSNPFGTSEYDGFKEDDDETAIKLLLCVNQLNEGVHIKGVDAVIMVRRTSSPTIFYQQLGRALTATGNFEPLVIDLVDNFEMIGIEQIVNMMSESYARLSDENDPKELIPPSAFKVIDHEKDARHLAKNLERRLALRSEKLTIDEKIALWKGL